VEQIRMIVEEIIGRFNKLYEKFKLFIPVVKEDKLVEEIEKIDKLSVEDPDFWNKRESKTLLKEQSIKKKFLEEFRSIKQLVDDCKVMIELIEAGEDEAEGELNNFLEDLEKKVTEFELRLILNGENDSNNAIVTIHSGAGGTEANDWANMLFRMYTMWVEKKNFKYLFALVKCFFC